MCACVQPHNILISREFREFLDDEAIASSTCPPHVHSLNGVAERAIRSIMELVRSNLVASRCPASFWPYLVDHALDVLNRTTGAPGCTRRAARTWCPASRKKTGFRSTQKASLYATVGQAWNASLYATVGHAEG